MSELKPCPFCGGESATWETKARGVDLFYITGCENEDCPVDCSSDARATQEDAETRWNTRQSPKAMIAELLLDEVRKATEKFPIWPTDPLHAVAILNEEVGELNQAILQSIYEPKKSGPIDVSGEAIQAGAMVVRFIMSLDKYNYSCSLQHEQEVCKPEQEG